MNRKGKGTAVGKYLYDYCVVDLETTSSFIRSAEIIEISALKVREGKVVGEYSQLVNPKCSIPIGATAVNNITDEMVKDSPTLDMVIDSFLEFVGDDVILGYNNAAFDMCIIYDKVLFLRNLKFKNDYIDVMHAVKRALNNLDNYKLETVSKYYGLDTTGEHRALKDCYLTKECYERINDQFGEEPFKSKSKNKKNNFNNQSRKYSAETKALRELHSGLEEIISDGKITSIEFASLAQWMAEHRDLQGNYPFDRVFDAIDQVLEDGKVTREELASIQDLFSEFVDPVKAFGCHDRIETIKDMHICMTGSFDYGEKRQVANLIEDAGGIIDDNVKKATNYLVVGAQGSDSWKTGKYGAKIQKAIENIEKGYDIKIFEENNFISAVRNMLDSKKMSNEMVAEKQSIDWKVAIQNMLDELIIETELPEKSLYLMANYGRDGNKITSYSICIYEPDYPLTQSVNKNQSRNSIALNIKELDDKLEILVGSVQFGDIDIPEDAEIKNLKSDSSNVHVLFSKTSNNLIEYVSENTKYSLANYTSKASRFGCCSKFNECSDAKKCIHENKLYSKACIYRGHLDAGRIFYGKNRNID